MDIDPNETVYVYREGDTIKVYPQSVISGHEIVNDKIGDNYFAISYCPLTGSALSWDREIDGTITEFGVSGHLYNDNLIPYDRNSNNMWSQMHLNRIKGNTGESKLVSNMLLTTNWRTINSSFPDALVLVDSSGHICNDSICVNPNHVSNEKEGVITNVASGYSFGIVNNGISNGGLGAMLMNYDNFTDSVSVITTYFRNNELIIIGSRYHQFIVAFINNSGNSNTKFQPLQNKLPLIFFDNMGNEYDITGKIVFGPDIGKRLSSPISYWAHSIAWGAFYDDNIVFLED